MSTADVGVLHVMKYRTVMVDGGLGLTWINELNQHSVARQKKENKNPAMVVTSLLPGVTDALLLSLNILQAC